LASNTCAQTAGVASDGDSGSHSQPRQYLLGDWGGERTSLASKGVTFDFFYVADLQANPVGGLRQNEAGWGRIRGTMDDYSKLFSLAGAQILGAFVGATLVWLHYLPHWKETPDDSLKLGVFCTAPAIRNVAANLISEIIGTFVLVFIAGAIFAKAVARDGIAAGLGPYLVGCLVWAIGLSLGGTTGYAINPARDLGPRIAHAVLPIAGKGNSDWGYAAIPVIGPLLGSSLAGLLIHILKF